MNGRNNYTRTFQKPKDTKKVLRRLGNYLYKFKWLLIIALVLTILSNLFALIGPYLSGRAIDAIGKPGEEVNFDGVYFYALLMVIFYLCSAIFSYVLSILMINISKKIVYKMREDAFNKILKLPVSYIDHNMIGDIISKMSYDIDTINTSLSSDLIAICTSIITVVGSLVMMLSIKPIMVLVFAVTLPISFLFTRIMLKKTQKLFKKRSQSLGELNGFVEEMITGDKTIKAYGKEDYVISKFSKKNIYACKCGYDAEYMAALTGPGVNFVNNLSLALISIFGAILHIYSDFSLGNISSFVLYSRRFSGPINEFANIFTDLQSALAAGERVFDLIDQTPEKEDDIDSISEINEGKIVEVKNIHFGYYKEKTIIHDLSFVTKEGMRIAIVGPTGAGKTTIVNLLMRFYDIDSGDILIDNESIYNIKRNAVRKNYAMVLQDTWLFQGSVYDNVRYGNENVSIDDVKKVCKIARIDNFIESLPNGYDTILTEGGINISKGEKQLLTIARAMLLDARMLILDEATSNVDTRTEIKIQEAMQELMKGKTSFIIAHRLSTIQNADLILVIDGGDIVEKGTHEELLKMHGFYHELYYSQFK